MPWRRSNRELHTLMTQHELAQMPLAGVCQSAFLVKSVARGTEVSDIAFQTSIQSIIETDPEIVSDVYKPAHGLAIGWETLIKQLAHKNDNRDAEITRYVASILTLERKLSKAKESIGDIAKRIEEIKRQTVHFSLFDTQMISNLASVYKDNISPLTHKIQVAGNPALLKQQSAQDKVRALLLAGVRSAFLWRQMGGKRRNIIFQRSKILNSAQNALNQINHESTRNSE